MYSEEYCSSLSKIDGVAKLVLSPLLGDSFQCRLTVEGVGNAVKLMCHLVPTIHVSSVQFGIAKVRLNIRMLPATKNGK
jgi:hypothetical protein